MTKRYTLTMDNDPAEQIELEEFIRDNADGFEGGDEAEQLRALNPGEFYRDGGGAAPVWTVRCEAAS